MEYGQQARQTYHTGARHHQWRGTAHIPQSRFREWQRNAAARGLEWAITIEDVETIYMAQDGRCALTRLPMEPASTNRQAVKARRDDLMSLDRIDNEKGYTLNNVQLVRWVVNRVRSDLTLPRFIELCRSVIATTDAA